MSVSDDIYVDKSEIIIVFAKGRKINEKIYNGSGSGNYKFTMYFI